MEKPFEGIFGNTCELRILEFLLPLEGINFNVSELAEEAGVSRVTTGRVVKKFVDRGILVVNPRKIPEYSINTDSPIVKSIDSMNNALIAEMLGDEKLEEISEYLTVRGCHSEAGEIDFSTESVWGRNSIGQYNENVGISMNAFVNPTSIDTMPFASADDGTESDRINYFQ